MIELGNTSHGIMIARATNAAYNPAAETVISRSERGELLGGTIFSSYTGSSLCMDVACFKSNWLSRSLLCITFRYAFIQLKCNVVIGRLWSTNDKAIKFDTHIGFKEHSRIEGGVPNGDLVILVLRKEDCRWLEPPKQKIQVWDHTRKVA